MAERLRYCASRFQGAMAALDVERMAAMHALGRTDDDTSVPNEAGRMRYYDPAVDDAVPPEPFADC